MSFIHKLAYIQYNKQTFYISRMVESENALQESIKRRGDKSYYYAHAPRNTDDPSIAKILEGEGIVTGGDPKLLVSDQTKVLKPKQVVNIRNYAWTDEDDKIEISTPYEDTEDKLEVQFTKEGFELVYYASEEETRKLIMKNLFKNIVPESCSKRLRRNKVVLSLVKEDPDTTWYQLTKS